MKKRIVITANKNTIDVDDVKLSDLVIVRDGKRIIGIVIYLNKSFRINSRIDCCTDMLPLGPEYHTLKELIGSHDVNFDFYVLRNDYTEKKIIIPEQTDTIDVKDVKEKSLIHAFDSNGDVLGVVALKEGEYCLNAGLSCYLYYDTTTLAELMRATPKLEYYVIKE
jgi:hypothetical protein